MIESVFNLLFALASVSLNLLDPMLQLLNGVDLYMEATQSSPLIVTCPPKVQNGSWTCSDRRPLPECYLFCPSGLVPMEKSTVDCETYRQDNVTNFACVPSGVLIVGGLDEQDLPVTQVETFSSDRTGQLRAVNSDSEATAKSQVVPTTGPTMISASAEWYDGNVVACGSVYNMSCSSLQPKNFQKGFEAHSVLENL